MTSAETSAETSGAEPSISPQGQQTLLQFAHDAIRRGVAGEELSLPSLNELTPELQSPRATFATLHRGGDLRGCCGSLRAFEPLAWNVIRSARTAALADRRFDPVSADEIADLDLHLSVLGPSRPIAFVTEADLVMQLRPGIDGVILTETDLGRQGVFLPAVWEQLPEPAQFVRRLKQKAGLTPDYWSPWLTAQRFEVQSIP